MQDNADYRVREIGQAQLRLRGDLLVTPQIEGQLPYYLVEDQLNSRFFRLGAAEYTFASQLDGRTTIDEALSRVSNLHPDHQLDISNAAGLCQWLMEMDLAQTAESSQPAVLAAAADRARQRRLISRFNLLAIRQPLARPDQLFARLAARTRWLFTPWVGLCWVLLVASGAYQVGTEWERFVATSRNILAADNWVWLAFCWLALKIVHEAAHGIACRHFGGYVREAGVVFVACAPLPYVDVTSSWRFRERWQRIVVAAAGMAVELALAAAAAWMWRSTSDVWLEKMCFNTIVSAGFMTILFNANPLMKFDGYFLLSDAIGMPNLYAHGQQYIRSWARRYVLGVPVNLPAWTGWQRIVIRLYGWVSLLWRLVVFATLTTAAATMFHGAGIILAAVAIVLQCGLPCLQFVRYLLWGTPAEQPRKVRFALLAAAATAIAVAVFGFLPWPGTRQAPAIVEYSPVSVIRAASAGFVRQVLVWNGQPVETGQLLFVLENPELERELADLQLQVRQSEFRELQNEQRGELAARQSESKKREALLVQLAEKRAQVELLKIHAPCTGQIIRRDPENLLQTYLKVGDEIAVLGQENRKELRLAVSQNDLEAFKARVGECLTIDVPNLPLWSSRLEKVVPRATLVPLSPALASINGGSLPVRPVSVQDGESTSGNHELLTPRFTAIVPLGESESTRLRVGQRAIAFCRPCTVSIGTHLFQAASNWLRIRLDRPSDD